MKFFTQALILIGLFFVSKMLPAQPPNVQLSTWAVGHCDYIEVHEDDIPRSYYDLSLYVGNWQAGSSENGLTNLGQAHNLLTAWRVQRKFTLEKFDLNTGNWTYQSENYENGQGTINLDCDFHNLTKGYYRIKVDTPSVSFAQSGICGDENNIMGRPQYVQTNGSCTPVGFSAWGGNANRGTAVFRHPSFYTGLIIVGKPEAPADVVFDFIGNGTGVSNGYNENDPLNDGDDDIVQITTDCHFYTQYWLEIQELCPEGGGEGCVGGVTRVAQPGWLPGPIAQTVDLSAFWINNGYNDGFGIPGQALTEYKVKLATQNRPCDDNWNAVEKNFIWCNAPGFSCELGVVEDITENVVLYPVPAISSITIEFGDMDFIESSVHIMDYSGRVFREEILNSSQTLDISNLLPGAYLVRLKIDGNSPVYKKFIKQ